LACGTGARASVRAATTAASERFFVGVRGEARDEIVVSRADGERRGPAAHGGRLITAASSSAGAGATALAQTLERGHAHQGISAGP